MTKRTARLSFYLLAAILITTIAIIFLTNQAVEQSSVGKLYTDTERIPYNKVGLLLGTGKYGPNNFINPYYQYRVDAAVALLRSGRITYLVISGDNSSKNYNEPEDMKQDIIRAGIDSSVIFLDYAGFRTFDSIVRLKEIFGQKKVTIISQPFHNERAVFIAEKEGIEAIAFNAKDVGFNAGIKIQLREKLARVKVHIDYLFGTSPKYLGEKVVIN